MTCISSLRPSSSISSLVCIIIFSSFQLFLLSNFLFCFSFLFPFPSLLYYLFSSLLCTTSSPSPFFPFLSLPFLSLLSISIHFSSHLFFFSFPDLLFSSFHFNCFIFLASSCVSRSDLAAPTPQQGKAKEGKGRQGRSRTGRREVRGGDCGPNVR